MSDNEKKYHPPEEIEHYIRHNYVGLHDATAMSIGVLGNNYVVVVTDRFHVNHKLNIIPREIDEHLKNLTDRQRTQRAPAKREVQQMWARLRTRMRDDIAESKDQRKRCPNDRER